MTVLPFLGLALVQLMALMAAMTGAWAIQQRTRNSGWVDVVWTLAVGAVGAASALAPTSGSVTSDRQILVAVLAGAWSLRLASHIAQRTANKADDPRYAKLIEEWGEGAPAQMLILLLKQALVSSPLVLSIALAAHRPGARLDLFDGLAAGVFVAAVLGEMIADRQLRSFSRSPAAKGKICTVGLWRYSRHPNYFFEWLHWIAYPLIAIDTSGAYPLGWLALSAPAVMYWLLRHVSGVPPLEEHMLRKHGAGYAAYQKSTSVFFPWVPRYGS